MSFKISLNRTSLIDHLFQMMREFLSFVVGMAAKTLNLGLKGSTALSASSSDSAGFSCYCYY